MSVTDKVQTTNNAMLKDVWENDVKNKCQEKEWHKHKVSDSLVADTWDEAVCSVQLFPSNTDASALSVTEMI